MPNYGSIAEHPDKNEVENMKLEFEIAENGSCDVIVVGPGPAGVAAAVLAGRNGARTLLVES